MYQRAEDASERRGAEISAGEATAQAFAPGIRPEVELLLYCAQPRLDSRRVQRVRDLLRDSLDWGYLIRRASQQGVMPLLNRSLHTTCPEEVPQAPLKQLQKLFHTNAGRNVLLTRELLTLLRLFETHGIPVVPYKGPVLAVTAYGSLALRQFSALDFLVQKQDFRRAKELLIAQGYRLMQGYGWESSFVSEHERVYVNLSQGIAPPWFPFPLDFERLWTRREPVCIAGTMVPSLSREDTLIILCVQAAKDSWGNCLVLAKLCDIAELLHAQQHMDWGQVMQEVRRLRSQRLLVFSLRLTSELLEMALPKEVSHLLTVHSSVNALVVRVRQQLFHRDRNTHPMLGMVHRFRFHFEVRECLQDKITPYYLYDLFDTWKYYGSTVYVMLAHSFFPLARTIYSRLMAPFGAYRLRQMLKEGLPSPFQMPLQYLFAKALSGDDQKVVDQVEAIRAALANRTDFFEGAFPGTADAARTAAQIAYRSSVTSDWGVFLYLCAKSFKAGTILELGSCAGISGCYLVSSEYCTRFITIEGFSPLAALAESNLRQISGNATVINARFDKVLDDFLPSIQGGIDLAYIDGHHEYGATLRYFQRLAPYLRKGALVVLDDIHWSRGMWEAWKVIRDWRGFAYTIDIGRFGVGLWDESATQKAYNLSLYTGWVRWMHKPTFRGP